MNEAQDANTSNRAQNASNNIETPAALVVLPDGSKPIPIGSGTVSAVLGEGGAAIVYEIWNEQLGVKRAVKVLKPNALNESFGRFQTEIRITAQLKHTNIIEIHSVGDWHGLPYIEMEMLQGQSLDKIITQLGALPVEVCLAVGIMVCRALSYTHNHDYIVDNKRYKGILHRDLKPANIMILEGGGVKLMDFGIATPTNTSMHTMEGTIVGSLQYLAPEQLEGKKASKSSDLFALGAVLYEMLTGRLAFADKNMAHLLSKRLKNEYVPLKDYHLNIPGKLIKLVNSCMALDPGKRIDDATELGRRLELILHGISNFRPEEIIDYFHSQLGKGERRFIKFRRKFPWKTFGIAAMVAVIPLAALFLAPLIRKGITRMQTRVETREVIREKIVEVPVPEKREPQPRQRAIAQSASAEARDAQAEPVAEKQAVAVNRKPEKATIEVEVKPVTSTVPKDLRTQLIEKYATSDLLAIMGKEVGSGNFADALKVYRMLSDGEARSNRALIFKMRALKGAKRTSALNAFLKNNNVEDSEFYLEKAKAHYVRGAYNASLTYLSKSSRVNAEFSDKKAIDMELLYFKALCFTGLHSKDKSDDNRKRALESWFNVKYAYRSQQGHRYYKTANNHIRSLAE
jgi:serine/threonine protein kinase